MADIGAITIAALTNKEMSVFFTLSSPWLGYFVAFSTIVTRDGQFNDEPAVPLSEDEDNIYLTASITNLSPGTKKTPPVTWYP
jgi:hypothetical protein